MTAMTDQTNAYQVAASTPDPELPMLTIEDLGILRSVDYSPREGVVVTITPTYSGCPAMREIAADVQGRLNRAGFERVTVAPNNREANASPVPRTLGRSITTGPAVVFTLAGR